MARQWLMFIAPYRILVKNLFNLLATKAGQWIIAAFSGPEHTYLMRHLERSININHKDDIYFASAY